jgi:hypothetical protein
MIKDRRELKVLAERVDPQPSALAFDNRFHAYQELRFGKQVGLCTVDTASEIVKEPE